MNANTEVTGTQIQDFLLKEVGFLKWAELSPATLDHLGVAEYIKPVVISPDTQGLHIVWECAGTTFQEIADYPAFCKTTLATWLSQEIGEDSMYVFENVNIWNVLPCVDSPPMLDLDFDFE